jgi:hypothetical protein
MKTWFEKVYGIKAPENKHREVAPIIEEDHRKPANQIREIPKNFCDFIQKHKTDFIAILSNGYNHNDDLSKKIIAAARIELGYKPSNVSVDIFRSLTNKAIKIISVAGSQTNSIDKK